MNGEQYGPLTIIGLGLIGGSLGMALRGSADAHWEIVGHDRARAIERRALALGAIDRAEPDLAKSVRGSDVVIIATPISAIPQVMREIAPSLSKSCTVTDTASTKGAVITMADRLLPPGISFVGGHPLAGKERQGIDHADAELFRGKKYAVVAPPTADSEAVSTILSIVDGIGAQPLSLEAAEHDQYTAAISHLPLVISTALFTLARSSAAWPDLSATAASAFRDLTRLASGDPTMSRDICETNREAILHWLDRYLKELDRYRQLISQGSDDLLDVFMTAQLERDRFLSGISQEARPGGDLQIGKELLSSLVGKGMMDRFRNRMESHSSDCQEWSTASRKSSGHGWPADHFD